MRRADERKAKLGNPCADLGRAASADLGSATHPVVVVVALRVSLGGGICKLIAAALPKQAMAISQRLRHADLDLDEGDLLSEVV